MAVAKPTLVCGTAPIPLAPGPSDKMVDTVVVLLIVIAAGILWFTQRRKRKAIASTVNYLIPGKDDEPLTPREGPRAFEPDGVYLGIPFKVRDGGEVEAMMVGGLVVFRDFDQFIASAKGESILHPD